MADPVKLKAVTAEEKVAHDVVDTLEEMLEKARTGEFSACLFVGFRPDGRYLTYASPSVSETVRLGAIEEVKWDILMARHQRGHE